MARDKYGKEILGALSLGAAVSAAAGAYKVSEAAIKLRKLREVAEDQQVFLRLLRRVREDIIETKRLMGLRTVKVALTYNTEKKAWIESVVRSTEAAARLMSHRVAHVQKDLERSGHVGLWNRIRWVLEDHERLTQLSLELTASHLGLLEVLAFVAGLEPLACCYEAGLVENTSDPALTDNRYRKESSDPGLRVASQKETYVKVS